MTRVDIHRRLFDLYQALPSSLKGYVRRAYDVYLETDLFGPSYRRDFVTQFFANEDEFESFKRAFHRSEFESVVEDARREHKRRTGHGRFAGINQYTAPRLYALVRKVEPDVILETGVCNGVSTYVILEALEANGHGSLYSVDYPDEDRIPEGEQPGWFIPDALRDRWSLTTGFSQEELPGVVDEIDEIDFFIHDTKAAILDEELEIVWPHLVNGAPTVADDIHQSDVFSQVRDTYSADAGFVAPNVGYMVKRAE
jgi:predicted O-methyltransferase YrrM